jgi:hypothetical protein
MYQVFISLQPGDIIVLKKERKKERKGKERTKANSPHNCPLGNKPAISQSAVEHDDK